MAKESAPVVPARNSIKSIPIVRERPDITGTDPNYRYERFSLDPRNPGFVDRKLAESYVGDDSIGYKQIPANARWEVVHRSEASQTVVRDDQGSSIDGTIRHGNTIMCRMPKDVWEETYGWADKARVSADQDRVYAGESEDYGSAGIKAIVSKDENADVEKLLKGVK